MKKKHIRTIAWTDSEWILGANFLLSFSLVYLFTLIKRKDDRVDGVESSGIEATRRKEEERLDFEIELYKNSSVNKSVTFSPLSYSVDQLQLH